MAITRYSIDRRSLLPTRGSLTFWIGLQFLGFAILGCSNSEPRQSSQPPTGLGSVSEQRTDKALSPDEELGHPSSQLVTAPGMEQHKFIAPLADAYSRIDPIRDGWDSEALGAKAGQQLVRFGRMLQAETAPAEPELERIISSTFSAQNLFQSQGIAVYGDETLRINRVDVGPQPSSSAVGVRRFQELRDSFRTRFNPVAASELKFKVVRVNLSDETANTEVYFHADGNSGEGLTELSAVWTVSWQSIQNELKINSVTVDQQENVTHPNSQQTRFADCTASVLGENASYQEQLLYGTDHWRSRFSRSLGLDVVANHGLAIGDVNGDGLDDLYLCQQGGLPNRLYIQQADGRLIDRSLKSGTDWLDFCASALLIDLDNDGDRDLVVGGESRIMLMENDGRGHFSLRKAVQTLAQTFSLTAADFDLDGDLDLFCCGYNPLGDRAQRGAMGEPVPYHDAQNGGRNMLLKNNSNWEFANVTTEVGLDQNNNRFSFAASWEDYDNDGDSDLYVANDYGRNNLYQNNQGTFRDVAGELGVEDMSAGMSVSWADFNRDGWMDFYVSNMFSAAGNRITFQRQFRSAEASHLKEQYQRHARGNSLFQADGKGGFADVSVPAGVTMGRWAWGSRFIDFNNDGWQDILIANGFITTADTGDL
ncbi:MAG: VCBS repeat-containing protein [Pirellulaceae bacterium]|nr:VCBS repeat-containing protein [Pirellulaceae bacterium]